VFCLYNQNQAHFMLLRFRFSNFRSFRTEQELSMVASSLGDQDGSVLHPSGTDEGVLPVAAMYGANASGKTNVILALQFMREAVKDSHAHWQPDEPIELEAFAGAADSPTTFSADFLLGGVRYQYGFSLSPEAVLEEWMYAYPLGKKQTWFAREKSKPISFSSKLQGDNRAIERLTRPNSLFLSAAAQNGHEVLSPVYGWFSQSLSFLTGERRLARPVARTLYGDAGLRETFARLLALADLGIADLSVKKAVVPEEFRSWLPLFAEFGSDSRFTPETYEVRLMHRIGTATLPFTPSQESTGTIAFLCVLDSVVRALANGGVVCVDELDHSLHPLLALELIRQFTNIKSNPESAQLIFNTHDTNLLSAGVLRRDQIWFTEKRQDGASQLYPLTDFKPRKHENLQNGYLQGRYGAIPFLNADWVLDGRHEEA
jgi:hypothetical protein